LSWTEGAKRKAVLKALEPIRNGWIIGLGSGSTMALALSELARRVKARRMDVSVVPTSHQVENLAISHNLRVISLNEAATVDYAIDGADQVHESTLDLIKGGGGAMLQEKVLDSVARTVAIVVDESKLAKQLGGKQLIPLEVLPAAHRNVQARVARIDGRARLREGSGKVGPVITDNGNFILDADFGKIENPAKLEHRLKMIPGLLETGLFLGVADVVHVGLRNGKIESLTAKHHGKLS
jgi:ribose 5-phosphate isomerase A